MRTTNGDPRPKTEKSVGVAIITFRLIEVRNVEDLLGSQLEDLNDELREQHLFLDFTHVSYINSSELATLIRLHKKLRTHGGRLTLFNLNPDIFEVFKVTGLHRFMDICR